MARLQQECAALPADSHGLTVLPFFSGEQTTVTFTSRPPAAFEG